MSYLILAILSSSIVLNILLIYAIFNLFHKFEIYEDWIFFFKKEIQYVYSRLKEVDNRNLFEKDDDVGFVFSEIIRIIEEFNNKIK
jgi:hypothetical protein